MPRKDAREKNVRELLIGKHPSDEKLIDINPKIQKTSAFDLL